MANVEQILGTIDAGLIQYLPVIGQLQDDYYQENGKYSQGLFTHSSPPVDNNSLPPDQLSLKPTDQENAWSDLTNGVMPATMLSRMKIDTYSGPSGDGYVVVLEKIINGITYTRHHNVGPEAHRSVNWLSVPEEEDFS